MTHFSSKFLTLWLVILMLFASPMLFSQESIQPLSEARQLYNQSMDQATNRQYDEALHTLDIALALPDVEAEMVLELEIGKLIIFIAEDNLPALRKHLTYLAQAYSNDAPTRQHITFMVLLMAIRVITPQLDALFTEPNEEAIGSIDLHRQ